MANPVFLLVAYTISASKAVGKRAQTSSAKTYPRQLPAFTMYAAVAYATTHGESTDFFSSFFLNIRSNFGNTH